ncbi:MAG: hypothetical protein K0S33_4125 [Bacteroidetes bacterium]|jgi:membrane protease YdiL (CAAX protease family)|nr:hypothetical protein [Bacteroidota bacterium]
MKINGKIKSYLLIGGYLVAGFLIIGIAQLLKVPAWLAPAFLLLLFVAMNVFTARLFRLGSEIGTFWSLRKILYLPVGILAGGLIAVSPALAALLSGQVSPAGITFGSPFTLSSIVSTLLIVAWEELWFRGIYLNRCRHYLSAIHISLTIGLLFTLVHLLNPEIELVRSGPALFFAGALLTLVYFYFKTIWLPIGLHFGNNYLSPDSAIKNDWLFGNEGYLGACILAALFLMFVKLTLDQHKRRPSSGTTKTI